MAEPLIGITTFRNHNRAGYPLISVNEAYIRAILLAGATPVLIPLGLDGNRLQTIFARVDGILFSGGGDIHPSFYNSALNPLVDDVDRDRDRIEIQLVRQSADSGKPFLGICRGMQVINVALGGSLYEDIKNQTGSELRHQTSHELPRNYLAHIVDIDSNSRLNQIIAQPSVQVNSFHHQAVRNLAANLRVAALAPDRIIEAIELPGHPFGLAVQWHPEWLTDDSRMLALFESFVQAANSD